MPVSKFTTAVQRSKNMYHGYLHLYASAPSLTEALENSTPRPVQGPLTSTLTMPPPQHTHTHIPSSPVPITQLGSNWFHKHSTAPFRLWSIAQSEKVCQTNTVTAVPRCELCNFFPHCNNPHGRRHNWTTESKAVEAVLSLVSPRVNS